MGTDVAVLYSKATCVLKTIVLILPNILYVKNDKRIYHEALKSYFKSL
jgi:hypothetical protein